MTIHRFVRLLMVLPIISLITISCGSTTYPVRQPIQTGLQTSLSAQIERTLASSTNCVALGESTMITLTFINHETTPWTIDPTTDLVVKARSGTTTQKMDRWSASSEYPSTFDPPLAPNEQRSYHWTWTPSADFVRSDGSFAGVDINYSINKMLNLGSMYIGVEWYTNGDYTVRCTEMR